MESGSDSGDDTATLAELLTSPPRKRSAGDDDGGYSGRRHRRTKRAATNVQFVKGDMVWAKVFPFTWWPGLIVRTKKGSSALVSFFLCNTTRWFQTSQVREFEGSYARMSETVGVKLSEAIELALAEIRLRTASTLACHCWRSVRDVGGVPVDRIVEVKKGLDPRGMLDFVLGMAVSALVDDSEAVSVIRASAQVIGFRRHVSVVEVKKGLDPRGMLDFVLGMAVSALVDDSEAVSVIRASAQVIGFRRHVSVCSDGGEKRVWTGEEELRGVTETVARPYMRKGTKQLLGDSSIDAAEGSGREVSNTSSEKVVSNTSSEKEVFHGGSRQLGCNFSVEMHEKDGELSVEQVQGSSNICMTNREDFNILECDEEHESLLHNQLVSVTGLSMEDNVEQQRKSIGSPSQESDVDAASDESFGHETVDNQSVGNETVFNIINKSTNSIPSLVPNLMQENAAYLTNVCIIQSEKDVAFSNKLVTGSETDMENDYCETLTSVAYTCNSSPGSDIDAACYGGLSSETDNHWNADNGTLFHISEGFPGSLPTCSVNHGHACIEDSLARDHAIHTGNDASLGNMLVMNSEKEIVGQQDNLMSVEHEISDSVSGLASSSVSFLPSIESSKELLTHPASMCSRQSPDETFNNITSQSNSKVSHVSKNDIADKESSTSIISGFLVPLNSASGISLRKGSDDQAVSCDNSKLSKVRTPSSEAVAGASHVKEGHCLTTDENTDLVMRRSRFLDEAHNDVVNELMMPSSEAVKEDHCSTTDKSAAVHLVTKRNRFLDKTNNDVVKSHTSVNSCILSHGSNGKAGNLKPRCSTDAPKHVSRNSLSKTSKTIPYAPSDWEGLYASPLIRDSSESTYKIQKPLVTDASKSSHKSLHIKFPKNFNLPSKEELEKKFRVFGPVDSSRTKVYFYTGSGRVVFLHDSDTIAAYRFVKTKSIFGQAKVLFWLDKYEKDRKEYTTQDLSEPLKEHISLEHSSSGLNQCNQDLSTLSADHSSIVLDSRCQESSIPTVGRSSSGHKQCSQDLFTPTAGHSSVDLNSRCQESSTSIVGHSPSNLKSCLKRPNMPMERNVKKIRKVRFLMET